MADAREQDENEPFEEDQNLEDYGFDADDRAEVAREVEGLVKSAAVIRIERLMGPQAAARLEKLEGHIRRLRARTATFRGKLWAWGVHAFTTTGVIWALLALDASTRGAWRECLGWMSVAVVIDSADGTLARFFEVKRHLPDFDGELLDNIIDFLNFVIVPAYFLHTAGLLPSGWAMPAVCLMSWVSAFQFCQADAKTADHYFKGFPCYWNVLAAYLFVLGMDPWTNLAVIVTLSVMVFVPIEYIYPSRTRSLMWLTMPLTVIWGVMVIVMLLQLPDPSPWVVEGSLLYVVYYTVASLWLFLRGKVRERREAREAVREGDAEATAGAAGNGPDGTAEADPGSSEETGDSSPDRS